MRVLVDGGYLKEWPVAPAFAFANPVQYDFIYQNTYDDTDGLGPKDKVLYVRELKNEVCEEFIRRYSSPGFGDMIYDFEAAGKKYPGETLGRHIKIYAINWSMATWPDQAAPSPTSTALRRLSDPLSVETSRDRAVPSPI